MRLGVRGRLFIVSLLLISLAGVASGIYLELGLRSWLEARLERTLFAQAATIREVLGSTEGLQDSARADHFIDRLGAASEVRVTLIAADGRVLGDSSVDSDKIAALENHSTRPEVIEAKRTGRGLSRRRSNTLDTDFLYAAIPVDAGFVRVSMPLAQIDETIQRLRFLIVAASLVGLLAAVAMSFLASHLMSRTLRRMVGHARGLVRGDGSRLDIASTDEIGRLAGSFNRLADELEGSLATLAAERSRFETVLDGMSEAVLALDADRRLTLVNSAARRLLDLEGPVEGRPIAELVHVPELIALASGGAQDADSAEFSVGPDDQPVDVRRTVLARARPIVNSGGVVIVMLDVSDMRRLERIRRDFVANVSHELRTPVSIVRANAETLLDGGLDDPKRAPSFVEAIYRNAERLSRIIADLLELSRLEAGRMQLDYSTIDLRAAAGRAIDAVRERATERGIDVAVDNGSDVKINVDRKALDQVLNNLLENAVKYTEPGGHVVVRTTVNGATVRVAVEDDGPGIPPKYRERIFERFYRIDKGRSRETGGTGLGLSIVKHYVEAMNGRVGVDHREPHGSAFWFELPLPRQGTFEL